MAKLIGIDPDDRRANIRDRWDEYIFARNPVCHMLVHSDDFDFMGLATYKGLTLVRSGMLSYHKRFENCTRAQGRAA